MFLSRREILDRISKGDLLIDPTPEDVGPFTVDVHLGTEGVILKQPPLGSVTISEGGSPLDEPSLYEKFSAGLGQAIVVHPGSFLMVGTLELFKIPFDLVAILQQRSALIRVGLLANLSTIDPGFQGKIIVGVSNLGQTPVRIYPGMRFLRAMFSQIETSDTTRPYTSKYVQSATTSIARNRLEGDLEKFRKLMAERNSLLQAKDALSTQEIRELFDQMMGARVNEKGKALERLTREIFRTIEGLKELDHNRRLRAEELDLVLQNNLTVGFWRIAGSPILVECKNWSDKVGSEEIGILFDKLESLGPDAKTAILVAPNGVTGDPQSDAVLKIREKRQKGRYIVVLDRNDLETIVNGTHAASVVDRKFEELWFI
jgi:deoxycytidine triphosphate deaminase